MDLIQILRHGGLLQSGSYCEEAVLWDGTRLIHPARVGFVGTITELWYEQVYTREHFYSPSDGDFIADIGAHVGLFSIWIHRKNPNCQIIAFEPSADNFVCLRTNLESAQAYEVKAYQTALGGDYGEGRMCATTTRSIDNRLVGTGSSDENTISIVPLRELFKLAATKRFALLKMDIEGEEYDVFANVDEETLRRFDKIALEYHDNLNPGALDLIKNCLAKTHKLKIEPDGNTGHGIIRASLRYDSL